MREREGKNLAKDLIHRLKIVRASLRKIRQLQPNVLKRYRQSLMERIQKAGIDLPIDDDRLLKEVIFFADKSDIAEETTPRQPLCRIRASICAKTSRWVARSIL